MTGSIRQRSNGTYELRVYRGVDPGTGRQRWATRTVHGSRRHATRELAALVEEVSCARRHAGTVADLLERWFETASPNWSVTTFVEHRSIVRHHLVPQLGHLPVADLTTTEIDALYARLLRSGRRDGAPLSPGTVRRVHSVLHRALAQAQRWDWIWTNGTPRISGLGPSS